MNEHAGQKPGLEIAIGLGKPKPDQEHADGQVEGDAMDYMDKKKMQEENDLAPEAHEAEGEMVEQSKMDKVLEHEGEEHDMLKQILSALADKGMGGGRPASSLGERAAVGAKAKLGAMMKK